jgi:hypothetical protein
MNAPQWYLVRVDSDPTTGEPTIAHSGEVSPAFAAAVGSTVEALLEGFNLPRFLTLAPADRWRFVQLLDHMAPVEALDFLRAEVPASH